MLQASPESPRMFDNDILDYFSRIPAWVVPLLYVPVTTAFVGWGIAMHGVHPAVAAGQFLTGWFVWTLMEYWLHRTVFHWVPKASWGEAFHFYLHGVHHKWFTDKYRLVMPPAASAGVAVVVNVALWFAASALAGAFAPSWVFASFGGIAFGYMVYDCTHYYIHHHKPRSKAMLALRAHHNKHHHNDTYKELKFGVSTTLWDHVFGTYEVR